MADKGFGRIVNIASLPGQNGGTATGGHYAASKGAILTTTKIFARELAAQGVTVNAISPGPHDLPVIRTTVPADKLDGIIAGIPVGRLGSASFIADTVALLTSKDAFFVTGACWDINGGLYLRRPSCPMVPYSVVATQGEKDMTLIDVIVSDITQETPTVKSITLVKDDGSPLGLTCRAHTSTSRVRPRLPANTRSAARPTHRTRSSSPSRRRRTHAADPQHCTNSPSGTPSASAHPETCSPSPRRGITTS